MDLLKLLEEHETMKQKQAKLEEEVTFLKSIADAWVPTETAERRTGIKRKALQEERDRPGTLLVYKRDGPKGGKILYCAESIRAYNKAKTIKRPRLAIAS